MMLHDLLRSDQLQAAVSWVLRERISDLQQYGQILRVLQGYGPDSNTQVAAANLAAYLLVSGDHPGARLAFLLALAPGERSKQIETCDIASEPRQCFQLEQLTPEGGRTYFIEPLIVAWSESVQALAVQNRVSPAIARLDRGSVFGLTFLPVTADRKTCLNWFMHNPTNSNKVLGFEDFNTIPILTPVSILGCFDSTDEHDAGILIGNNENFGHWLLNHLARLAYVSSAPGLDGVPLIVGENTTATQLECLARMGYDESKLIRLRKGRLARFRTLWVPMMPLCTIKQILHWSPRIVDFLRTRLGVKPLTGAAHKRRCLYITRRESRWRRLLNEDAILALLARWRFETVDPGTLSFTQQIDLAADAEVILGAFGAGMQLLIFAPADANIIELKYQKNAPGEMNIHPALCRQIGQRYSEVMGIPRVAGENELNYDFTVAPDRIEEALKATGLSG